MDEMKFTIYLDFDEEQTEKFREANMLVTEFLEYLCSNVLREKIYNKFGFVPDIYWGVEEVY